MTDIWLILLFALAIANFLSLLLLIVYGDSSARSRLRRIRRSVAAGEDPMALTDRNGQVIEANAAMRGPSGAEGRKPRGNPAGIEALLGDHLASPDPGLIFRLSRAAARSGYGVEEVALAEGGIARLAAVAKDDELTLWVLHRGIEAADEPAVRWNASHADAPFIHLRRESDGRVVGNRRFAEAFGSEAGETVLGRIEALAGNYWGGRVLLPDHEGTVRVFRVFAPEGGPDGATELFLFEVGPADTARRAALRLLEAVPVALAQFDLSGRLVWSNGPAAAVLGATPETGISITELFEPLGRPVETIFSAALAGADEPVSDMVRLAGSESFVQIALTSAEIEDRQTVIAVITDASEIRRLEEKFAQSQKMEAVGKLAGGVAHDFNNVLTAITGHCDLLLLRKDPSHPDYSDLIQIAQNANRAAALVRQLLAFSRKQTMKPVRLNVRDIVTDTHYLLDRLVGDRVTLQLDFAPDVWPVRADAQQLEQALMNLVVNARDAIAGEGTVTIACRNLTLEDPERRGGTLHPPGDFVEITVADTGPGIEPQVIDKIFDPFFTTKPKGEGTGLGLSTVYGIVKQSGGFITAENAPGAGALFRIRLPRADGEAPAITPRAAPEAPGRDLTGSGAILLVEDEDPVRAFAARALRLRGYDVHEAGGAEQAMALIDDPNCTIDLLITDVMMPGMDGPTFAGHAREKRPELKLIFVSGYAEEAFRKNLTETEFSFLPKPFSLNQLTARVKEVLEAREQA